MEPALVVEEMVRGRQARDTWPAPHSASAEPESSGAGAGAGAAGPGASPVAVAAVDRRRPIRAVRDEDTVVLRIAQSRVSVVITGETGVGKEVLARRLHDLSPRAGRPFMALNCAAICDNLLESELFGYQRGAFTGAEQPKAGLIEAADGGTVFLDEVGELTLAAQAKLLRVIETRSVMRIGAVSPREVDVRFLSATNRGVDGDVAAGRFRADLLFRLDGMRLHLPPLRERAAEILPAAEQFLVELAARDGRGGPVLTDDARGALRAYPWPGNFRELRNVIERAALLCHGGRIEAPDLMLRQRAMTVGMPAPPQAATPDAGAGTAPGARERILAALKACAGNQTRAARLLGVSRRTLINWLEAHAIPRPRKRGLKVVAAPASPAEE